MSGWGLYFVFLIPPMIIGFVVQHWLKKTVAAQMQVGIGNADHYDPRKKSVHLSEPVYAGRSVASTAIAAHEVGHAIQHEKAYAPFRLRSAMWPAVAFASQAWLFILMIGLFAQIAGVMTFAIVSSGESQGARKVLTAAAMTYVAAALAALSQLAYWLLILSRR